MSSISLDHSCSSHGYGEREFRRLVSHDPSEHVILIDTDSDIPKKRRCPGNSRDTNWSSVNIIHINDDENADDKHYRAARYQLGNNFSGPSESAADNVTPVRLSKCKRTYSGNTQIGSLHGSYADSVNIPSGFDFCELVEDSNGKIQPLWSKSRMPPHKPDDISYSEIGASNVGASPKSKLASDDNNFDENPIETGQESTDEDIDALSSDDVIDEIRESSKEALASESEQECIFLEREMIKETDEYRMAMEEEWASRKEALHVQAQEAKHLRILAKRKKAETLRLLDTERRQKERLDEIRNSQKQKEEIANLKEEIRVEFRKKLNTLELKCKKNMASLLHKLGISVVGWPKPSPQQVLISCKKALVAFHPDRASRFDIREQVEAEEKFKLINRVKDNISQKQK